MTEASVLSSGHEAFCQLRQRLQQAVLGQAAVIDRMLIALLADGHLLLEGVPGLANTRAVKALAAHLNAGLSGIQFTPDLLPSDITGSDVYLQSGSAGAFRFDPGPIFSELVLADEINRAPAKVQSALLEAMEERQVTVGGNTHRLPELFMVLATQNPIEQEGTYALPEAQMDRFVMKVLIDYVDEDTEIDILRTVRRESGKGFAATVPEMESVSVACVMAARDEVQQVFVSPAIERYILNIVCATRKPHGLGDNLVRWIQGGASPRGTLALERCARAHAWLAGRDYVTLDDVRAVLADCLRHRIIPSYEALAGGVTVDHMLSVIAGAIAAP
ncbi:MoxR family ATPase [Pseudomonas sp. TH10]|uniref:AAA family ATPase n=1 Tax=Pseudomonas sp. TH10 TaxID=2796376 RepID=UPI0019145E2E|nr:MoxR family ATPase [Pseudomonas sp. TH10]MBK5517767.1 MoxR family ATPase [Pseudomonas sp. TH10]